MHLIDSCGGVFGGRVDIGKHSNAIASLFKFLSTSENQEISAEVM